MTYACDVLVWCHSVDDWQYAKDKIRVIIPDGVKARVKVFVIHFLHVTYKVAILVDEGRVDVECGNICIATKGVKGLVRGGKSGVKRG